MADACCAAQTAADSPVRHACPACGVQGCAVELLTVKAQLTETALARMVWIVAAVVAVLLTAGWWANWAIYWTL